MENFTSSIQKTNSIVIIIQFILIFFKIWQLQEYI
jgi:hypothetical protein